jgi:hypothetical protein
MARNCGPRRGGEDMFDWLFEGHLSVYVLLAAAAVLLIVLGARTRDRRWYATVAGVVALAGLYRLLDFAVETDREQIQRKVKALAAGLKAPANLDAVLENVSDQFHCPFADSKTALREKAREQINTWNITEVRISDLRCGEISRERNRAVAEFRAKVIGTFGTLEAAPVFCTATFDYQPPQGWQMRELEVRGEGPLQGIPVP